MGTDRLEINGEKSWCGWFYHKYYNQKLELLELVSDLNDTQLIMEIVNGVPQVWLLYLNVSRLVITQDLQAILKFHADTLVWINTNDLAKGVHALKGGCSQPQIQVTLVVRSSDHSRKPRQGLLIPILQRNPLGRIITPTSSKGTIQSNPKTFLRNALVVTVATLCIMITITLSRTLMRELKQMLNW
jgi:hypothetical protein